MVERGQSAAARADAHAAWRPWVLIAAKRFSRAKSRLGTVLPAADRRALASAMFQRVLDACTHCAPLHGTLVATDGDDVAALAERRAAAVLHDAAEAPLAQVIDTGLRWLRAQHATHALVIMADLPLVQARDIAELLAHLRTCELLLSPDAQRRGTSALGLRLDLDFHSCFGRMDSLRLHRAQAARIGARCDLHVNPRVAFDIDTPEDLASWSRRLASG